jgi:hypothetical protein
MSIPTNRNQTFSGIQATSEVSIPSPTAEHQSGAPLLNNDRVVQRRRAGQRSLDKYRPAPPSPLDTSPARSGGTLAPTLLVFSEYLSFYKRTGFVRFDLLGPDAGLFFVFSRRRSALDVRAS